MIAFALDLAFAAASMISAIVIGRTIRTYWPAVRALFAESRRP